MRSPRGALLLLCLAGCGSEGGSSLCASHDEVYRLTATVSLPAPTNTSDDAQVAPGRLLASVLEEQSIVACHDGLVSTAQPGSALVSQQPVYVDAAGFTLRVSATVYPELEASELWLHLLFDENENGRCDDGEPIGVARIERGERIGAHVDLARAPCPILL